MNKVLDIMYNMLFELQDANAETEALQAQFEQPLEAIAAEMGITVAQLLGEAPEDASAPPAASVATGAGKNKARKRVAKDPRPTPDADQDHGDDTGAAAGAAALQRNTSAGGAALSAEGSAQARTTRAAAKLARTTSDSTQSAQPAKGGMQTQRAGKRKASEASLGDQSPANAASDGGGGESSADLKVQITEKGREALKAACGGSSKRGRNADAMRPPAQSRAVVRKLKSDVSRAQANKAHATPWVDVAGVQNLHLHAVNLTGSFMIKAKLARSALASELCPNLCAGVKLCIARLVQQRTCLDAYTLTLAVS